MTTTPLHPFAVRRADTGVVHGLFVAQAAEIADQVMRPAMDSALAHLARDGGGGRIEECSGEDTHSMRLILWMPLDLECDADRASAGAGRPRRGGNPYLEFTIKVATCVVEVSEFDTWDREGTPGATSPCRLAEITGSYVTQRAIEILRRAAGPGVAA
jgi:hypothetical protein